MNTTNSNGLQPESSELQDAASTAGKAMYRASAIFGFLTLAVLAATKVTQKIIERQEPTSGGDEPIQGEPVVNLGAEEPEAS